MLVNNQTVSFLWITNMLINININEPKRFKGIIYEHPTYFLNLARFSSSNLLRASTKLDVVSGAENTGTEKS